MATSGYHGEDENKVKCSATKWPLEYLNETKEFVCGWCGQVLTANHDDLEKHFQNCKNSEETALLVGFKDLLKVKQKFEGLKAKLQTRVDTMKAELMEEIKMELNNIKVEVGKEMEMNKTEINKGNMELKTEIKTREAGEELLLNKVNVLEDGIKEKMREMGAAQEMKMAEVNGRFTGVTETISTVVHSMLEVKGKEVTSSVDTVHLNELDRSKKETEALWLQLKKSEGYLQAPKTGLEDEVEILKTRTETLSEQVKTNSGDFQVLKKQIEDEQAKNKFVKEKGFHVEPSPFDQLAIPMNCFNLVTQNYLFQPCFRWTIDDIRTLTEQKTFELNSQVFQWNGYPVQARAKLQLKKDDYVYLSLCMKDVLKDESKQKIFKPIPLVFYLLKDKYSTNPSHKCKSQFYLTRAGFNYLLPYSVCLVHKSWLNDSKYNINDSVEIEVYVEPSSMTQHVHSYDGTLEWSIENYKKRLQLEKEKLVLYQDSPYFYTSARGYRVQVEMYLTGNEGDGVTARILFATGKFDAELLQFFPHSTTVTLINHKDVEGSVTKTVVQDAKNKAYQFEMCKFEELEKLIENDTLFCKVVIKAQ